MKTKIFFLTFIIRAFIFTFLFQPTNILHAQEYFKKSIVIMKDSSKYEGQIIENIKSNDYFIIKLTNGDLKQIKKNEVAEIKQVNTELMKVKNNDEPFKKSFFSVAINGGQSSSLALFGAMEGFDATKIKPSLMIGGSGMYVITQWAAFEALITYNRFRITENGDDIGKLTFVPVILNFKTQLVPVKKNGIGFHSDYGAGFAFTKFKNGNALHDIEESTGVTIKVETNKPFVFNLGMGFEYFINKIAIGFDMRLLTGNVATDWKFDGYSVPFSNGIHASSFIWGFNLRYCFRKSL